MTKLDAERVPEAWELIEDPREAWQGYLCARRDLLARQARERSELEERLAAESLAQSYRWLELSDRRLGGQH